MPSLADLISDNALHELEETRKQLHFIALARTASYFFKMPVEEMWGEILKHKPNTAFSYGGAEMRNDGNSILKLLTMFNVVVALNNDKKVKFYFRRSQVVADVYNQTRTSISQASKKQQNKEKGYIQRIDEMHAEWERQETEYLDGLKKEADMKQDYRFRSPKSVHVMSREPKSA